MSEINQLTVDFLRVLGDQTRLEILDLLRSKEITQADIQKELGITQSTISQHLKTLINSNLIEVEKKDNKNHYKAKFSEIFELIKTLNTFVIKLNKEKISDIQDLDIIDTLF